MKGAWLDGPNVKSTYYGLFLIKHLVPEIWELGSQNKEKSDTLNEFETKFKSWYPDQCACRLCKLYKEQLGFIVSIYALFSCRISLSQSTFTSSELSIKTLEQSVKYVQS